VFGAITTAHSGLTTYRTWLDAVSDNIANVNTATSTDGPAFQPRTIVAQALPGDPRTGGGGVQVTGVELGDPVGRLVHQPDHPLADADGFIRMPSTDLASEMTSMIVAQRAYQANIAVVERARDAYLAALQLGRS
jgi:flagellar basal-body rod protein FlgC